MNTRLISITQAASGDISPEQLIVYVARVSNPSNQHNHETADRLIRYLIKNKHWSPFEHVSMTIEIKTSRAIAAQILRHRSFSFQEFSQRYSEVTEFEPIQLRKQADKNRQSSSEEFNPELDDLDDFWNESVDAESAVNKLMSDVKVLYNALIKVGVAKECARLVLPLATSTTIYMTGNIRSWLSFLNIRLDKHAQKEIVDIATEIAKILEKHFPNTTIATDNFNNFEGMFM